ncbi:hypothetical protein O181_004372 [Austropuccinia psidii MF-1]|uniref:Uncharacterized protein n=1 Tax=Austropuccinia psidii MF-1 TaxID=1389203 RepID=A0A9Q3BGN4_9BASI|nr:hypothetical protein [Austropuccinia psidii MF-1]
MPGGDCHLWLCYQYSLVAVLTLEFFVNITESGFFEGYLIGAELTIIMFFEATKGKSAEKIGVKVFTLPDYGNGKPVLPLPVFLKERMVRESRDFVMPGSGENR